MQLPPQHRANGPPRWIHPSLLTGYLLPSWTHFCPWLSHTVKNVFLVFSSVMALSVAVVETAKEKPGAVYD